MLEFEHEELLGKRFPAWKWCPFCQKEIFKHRNNDLCLYQLRLLYSIYTDAINRALPDDNARP